MSAPADSTINDVIASATRLSISVKPARLSRLAIILVHPAQTQRFGGHDGARVAPGYPRRHREERRMLRRLTGRSELRFVQSLGVEGPHSHTPAKTGALALPDAVVGIRGIETRFQEGTQKELRADLALAPVQEAPRMREDRADRRGKIEQEGQSDQRLDKREARASLALVSRL